MNFDWREVVSGVAPVIGGALGGPAGAAAVKILSAILLGKRDGTEQEIAEAVSAGLPADKIVELRRADQGFKIRMEELAAQRDKDFLSDVADARKRDTTIVERRGTNTRANIMIVGAVVVMLSCLVVLVLYREKIPGEVVGIVSTIAGIAGACLRDAFQFEFGSSRGSIEKTGIIDRLTKEE